MKNGYLLKGFLFDEKLTTYNTLLDVNYVDFGEKYVNQVKIDKQ